MPKYNTMYDVAFSYEHDYEDPSEVPPERLIEALEKRVNYLKSNLSDAAESFGVCDTYEIPTNNEDNNAHASSN